MERQSEVPVDDLLILLELQEMIADISLMDVSSKSTYAKLSPSRKQSLDSFSTLFKKLYDQYGEDFSKKYNDLIYSRMDQEGSKVLANRNTPCFDSWLTGQNAINVSYIGCLISTFSPIGAAGCTVGLVVSSGINDTGYERCLENTY